MATLRKSSFKCGNYIVDFEVDGKRYIRSTRTKDIKTARLILKDIEVKIAKGIFKIEDITPRRRIRYIKFVEEYLQYSASRKTRKTYLRDRLSFNNFQKFIGNPFIEVIDRRLIDEYLNKRTEEVSKSTVNIELRHLKAAFTLAVHWCYVDENSFQGVKPLSVPQQAPTFFTEEQLTALLEKVEAPLRQVLIFAANTGVRIGELVNIEWTDIDFERGVIRIRNKKDFTTKSKLERSIPINDKVFSLLTRLSRKDRYIFASNRGGRRCSAKLSKQFTKYLRGAGFEREFTFHSLRHTFASHLVQKGVSIYIVSKLLGHSNIKTTEIYSHLSPETFHDAVSLLGPQGKAASTQLSVVRAKQANLDA